MKKILVVISPGRQSTEGLHWVLHKAKEGHKGVKVVYVIDDDMTEAVQQNLADSGFVGDRLGEELTEALSREFLQRGKKILDDVEKQCRTFGVSCESEIRKGNYFDLCVDLSSGGDVDLMVVTERKVSLIQRLFEGSEPKRLRAKIACEIKSYRN